MLNFVPVSRHIGLSEDSAAGSAGGATRRALSLDPSCGSSWRPHRSIGFDADGAIVGEIRAILELHNLLEENPGGFMSNVSNYGGRSG